VPPILAQILSNLASRDRIQLRSLKGFDHYGNPEALQFLGTIFERQRHQITSVSLTVSHKESVADTVDLLLKLDAHRLESFEFSTGLPHKESPAQKIVEFFKLGCHSLTRLILSIELSTADSRLLLNTIAETTGNLEYFELYSYIGSSQVDLSESGHFGPNAECLAAAVRANAKTLDRMQLGVGLYGAHKQIWELALGPAAVQSCIRTRDFKGLDKLCREKLGVPLRTIYARTGSAWALWAVSELYDTFDPLLNLAEFDPLFDICHGDSIDVASDFSQLIRSMEFYEHVHDPIHAWLPQQVRKLFKRASQKIHFDSEELTSIGYLCGVLHDFDEPHVDDFDLVRALVEKDSRVLAHIIADRSSSQHTIDILLRLLQPQEMPSLRMDHEISAFPSSLPDIPLFTLESSSPLIQPIMEHPTFNALHVDCGGGSNWLERCHDWKDPNEAIPSLIKIFVNKFIAQSKLGEGWRRLFDTTHFIIRRWITLEHIAAPLVECLIAHRISREAFLKIDSIHRYQIHASDADREALNAFSNRIPI
jgi:hypothetical protein